MADPQCREKTEGYLAWHAKSERNAKAGQRQVRCPGCDLWAWPDEYDRHPPLREPTEGAG